MNLKVKFVITYQIELTVENDGEHGYRITFTDGECDSGLGFFDNLNCGLSLEIFCWFDEPDVRYVVIYLDNSIE